MRLLKWMIGLSALLTVAGCEIYDPFIGDGVVIGTWTIDGNVPDTTLCAEAGIDRVQVEVYRYPGETVSYTTSGLSANCEDGELTSPELLRVDQFNFQWVALSASGAEIARSDFIYGETTAAGQMVDLGNVDFEVSTTPPPPPPTWTPLGDEFTADAEWTINGGVADATTCSDAGIAIVALRVQNEDMTEEVDLEFDCELGGFDSRNGGDPVFAAGMYFTQWVGKDASGGIVAGPVPMDALVLNTTTNTHGTLQGVDFVVEVAQPLGLEVTMAFEVNMGAMDYGTCAEASIDFYGFELKDSSGTTVDSMFGVMPCQEVLTWDDSIIVSGETYTLDINADGTDGTKWGMECTGLEVLEGLEQYNCTIDITP